MDSNQPKGGTHRDREEAHPLAGWRVFALDRLESSNSSPKLSPMAELWRWWYFDPVRKKRLQTRYVLTEAEARERYGDGVEKVAGTREERAGGSNDVGLFGPSGSGPAR